MTFAMLCVRYVAAQLDRDRVLCFSVLLGVVSFVPLFQVKELFFYGVELFEVFDCSFLFDGALTCPEIVLKLVLSGIRGLSRWGNEGLSWVHRCFMSGL
jgi:hypothetical protein